MMVSPGLAMLFLLRSSNAELCPESCKCTSTSQGMAINCSFRGLQEIPFIPETTTELYLHNNFLTTVAPGTFDKLQSLRNVSLHNNVWNCDCHIAYLKQWLQSPPAMVHPNVTCFTPTSIRMKLVAKLRGNEYSSCRSHNQYRCQDLYFESIALCLLYLLLLILIMYSLTCVKSIPYIFTPNIGFNEFELTPLIKRSPVRCLQDERIWELTELESSIEWTSDILIEKPFPCESMEILPQVLSTLRSKHNIKIKLH